MVDFFTKARVAEKPLKTTEKGSIAGAVMLDFLPSHLWFSVTPASCFSSKYLFFFVPLLVFLLLMRLRPRKQTDRKMNRRRKLKKRKAKQSSRKISWSIFPSDVEDNILSRLPVKSLMRFKCVCKHWCNLVAQPHFIKLQLNRSNQIKQGSKLAYVTQFEVFSVDIGACRKQYMTTSAHPKDHGEKLLEVSVRELFLSSKDQNCAFVEILGSCNGVLCLSALDGLYLLNPSTKEFNKLPYPDIKKLDSTAPAYGFGYCPRTDEYKLMIMAEQSTHSDVYVFTFGTNSSWRSIGATTYRVCLGHYGFFNASPHVLVNGAVHWMASGTPALSIVPISFDLEDEKFKELSLPKSFSQQDTNHPIGLVELGGFLSLYHCKAHENFDIWVMKDYGDEQSWTKKFSVPFRVFSGVQESIKPLCILRNEEVVLFESEVGFFIVDIVMKQKLFLLGVTHLPRSKMYLESLVSLRTDGGVDGTNKEEGSQKKEERSAEEATII